MEVLRLLAAWKPNQQIAPLGCRLACTLKGHTGAGHHLEVPVGVESAEPR